MTNQTAPILLLRMPEVVSRVGLSKTEIYRRIDRREFPAPIALGPNTRAWPSNEIDTWIAERIAAARAA